MSAIDPTRSALDALSIGIPLADRILDGTAPRQAREAAARGALPLTRDAMLVVLVHLVTDREDEIRAAALASLHDIPHEELAGILANAATHPSVLDFYVGWPGLGQDALVGLLSNPSLTEDSLVRVASAGTAAAIDSLLVNQQRLTQVPAALDALSENPTLTPDQRRRLLDFTDHIAKPDEPRGEAPEEPAEPVLGLGPDLTGPVSESELRAMLGQLGDLPFLELEVGDFMKQAEVIEWDQIFEEGGKAFETVYNQILRMNPPQRLRAALQGGREARAILIRDTNRMVSSAVLRNPKLTDDEVVSITAQKSLSESLLRQIGSSRAWMGNYAIVLNLVKNPKTPLATAMNNISRLNNRDLNIISKDRNVPEVIARSARRQIELRQPSRGAKKH